MVYPVSGYSQQPIPASNTFQPGGSSETVKREEQARTEDTTKSAATDSARSERSSSRTDDRGSRDTGSRSEDTPRVGLTSSSRGTQLDITV
jgi:hypothetical protein